MKQSPTVSIIIPVLHEKNTINSIINQLNKGLTKKPDQIIVVDGSETKETINEITDTTVLKLSSQKGRAIQMNKGAAHASGQILIFLHADTKPPKNAIEKIQQTMNNPQIVAGAFSLQIQSKHKLLKIAAKFSTIRSHITRAPYGDQIHFIRKTFFDEIQGYKNIPIMEDVELMRQIKKHRGKIKILPDYAITSDRRWQQEGILYTTLRNTILISLYWCKMPPEKLAKFYPAHTTKKYGKKTIRHKR